MKIILRTAAGIILGIVIYGLMAEEASGSIGSLFLWLLWGIGVANSFRFHLMLMGSILQWASNLSIISWTAFGSGMIGLIFLLLLLVVMFGLGWIYGWYLLIRDLIRELKP